MMDLEADNPSEVGCETVGYAGFHTTLVRFSMPFEEKDYNFRIHPGIRLAAEPS